VFTLIELLRHQALVPAPQGIRCGDGGQLVQAPAPKQVGEGGQSSALGLGEYVVYAGVIPAAQHKAIGKLARKTNHIERFNNTLRQRVSRLVRDTLSFSPRPQHNMDITTNSKALP
jgi:hypothetical protein